jgi:hypothetical protein
MTYDEKTALLDTLQNLLEMQIKLALQGDASNKHSGLLSKQAAFFVEKIAEAGILELPDFQNRREHIHQLYQQLSLIVAAQKADTTEKLHQVRKTKKIVATYRSRRFKHHDTISL